MDDIRLTEMQRKVLLELYDPETKEASPLKGKEIADRLGISLKELVSLITFLESLGYIEKCVKNSPAR